MKKINKIYLIAIILIILTFGLVSCKGNEDGNDKKEVSDDGIKEESSSEDYYRWMDNEIYDFTDEGKKQKTIVVPERCEKFGAGFGNIEAVEVNFEGDKIVDLEGCFKGAETIEKIELPEKLEIINSNEFMLCNSLKFITIPDTVTEVEGFAFNFIESLESVIFEGGTTTIGKSAFYRCPKLKEVILPEGLVEIGSNAFGECEFLKEIKLPASLKRVDQAAFANGGITDIYCPSKLELEFYHETTFMTSEDVRPARVHVVEGSWADQNFDEVFPDFWCEKVYYEE